MKITLGSFAMCTALTCMITGSSVADSADLILRGAKIYTMNPHQPTAEAVAVRGDRIIYVGPEDGLDAYRDAHTEVITLKGQTVLPGLIDAHGHLLSLGRSLAELSLLGTTDIKQIRQMILQRQAQVDSGAWITGRGWDQNDWPTVEFPTWRDLKGTERNPVYLRRVDGHAAWLNKKALELCGLSASVQDPPGGRILRDADGEPTGVLIDNAIDLVQAFLPQPSQRERLDWARAAIRECHRLGLVGIGDAGVDSAALEVYRELQKSHELNLRIYAMLSDEDNAFLEEQLLKGPETSDPFLTIRAIKTYADGALGSRGAALLEPYNDYPSNQGLFIHSREYYAALASKALQKGFQVCAHAIGDAANRLMLDVYTNAFADAPKGDYRWRIEHAQVIAPQDIPRFAQRGIIASMQPTHATSDMPWAENRLGAERIKGAYAWRKLLASGAQLAFGSDFPVESPNPLWGIYAAVTRQDQTGSPPGGWHPEERLSIQEAVRGFTLGPAYAEFAEKERGSIEVGKLADFTVLDRDIYAVLPPEILKTNVIMTLVGGKVVYDGRK